MTEITTIIFDLSDVLIQGLTGIEDVLQHALPCPKAHILPQLRSDVLIDYLLGYSSEDEYLRRVQTTYKWPVTVEFLKTSIRAQFDTPVPGMPELLKTVSLHYPIYLLSDHGREWIQYIEQIHPFLQLFTARFYSFDLQKRKTDPALYAEVLNQIGVRPEECLFIDDRLRVIEVATDAGLRCLQFQNSQQLSHTLHAWNILRKKEHS